MRETALFYCEATPMKKLIAASIIAQLLVSVALAQHQPYAGQQGREIKALSAEEISQYLSGAGMGYAKSAELNHYPGPAHVLELADRLKLTPEQRASAKRLMDVHRLQAQAIGAKLVESERALEALFENGKAEQATLAELVRATAVLHGEYRLSHLDTHRQMRALLSDEQVAQYDRLRGYAATEGGHGGMRH
jgi:Spy/CpxP family protein refolding chaperone